MSTSVFQYHELPQLENIVETTFNVHVIILDFTEKAFAF